MVFVAVAVVIFIWKRWNLHQLNRFKSSTRKTRSIPFTKQSEWAMRYFGASEREQIYIGRSLCERFSSILYLHLPFHSFFSHSFPTFAAPCLSVCARVLWMSVSMTPMTFLLCAWHGLTWHASISAYTQKSNDWHSHFWFVRALFVLYSVFVEIMSLSLYHITARLRLNP